MDFHYSPLQMIFDAWIIIVLAVWALIAALKLRGRRRLCVVIGLLCWILGTALWLPVPVTLLMQSLAQALGPEVVWQLPTLPWFLGAGLVALGVLLPVQRPAVALGPPTPQFPPPGDDDA